MYIEQDCNVVAASMEGKKVEAAGIIRTTGREMEQARLQNYDAHNSTAINECIAQVRKDLTDDGACGKNYVHCADVSGLYLDYNTGEPIYSPDFFKLEKQVTLEGDFMRSNTNRLLLALLERKKSSAARGLDTCRDVADSVWDEFKRQAVIEIYQLQQGRVKQVRDECLSAVEKCYDEKIGQLKNFGNIDEQIIIGQSVGTAEALCKEKLLTCSNVFGGGAQGMAALIDFAQDLGSAMISEGCEKALDEFIHDVCAPVNDTAHGWPYACRLRQPGSFSDAAGSAESVYGVLKGYAQENCLRPGEETNGADLPPEIAGMVSKVFDVMRFEMIKLLKAECSRYSGEWMDYSVAGSRISNVGNYVDFVGAPREWGICLYPYCAIPGDAIINANGVKECCKSYVNDSNIDSKCEKITSSTSEFTCPCNGACIWNDSTNDKDKCTRVTCPTNSSIDTTCDGPEDVKEHESGGCVFNDMEVSKPLCRCDRGANAVKNPGVDSEGKKSTNTSDNIYADACVACPANSVYDASCPSASTPAENGCVAKYCRCTGGRFNDGDSCRTCGSNSSFAFFCKGENNPENCLSEYCNCYFPYEYAPPRSVGIATLPAHCKINCPANSEPDVFSIGANATNPEFCDRNACPKVGCRCKTGYYSNGSGC
jgi:hypothetical protein